MKRQVSRPLVSMIVGMPYDDEFLVSELLSIHLSLVMMAPAVMPERAEVCRGVAAISSETMAQAAQWVRVL